MSKIQELLQRLYSSTSTRELVNTIDSMILSGNYEIALVLSSYFQHTNIKNNKLYIIRALKKFPDVKNASRLLMTFINDMDYDVKLEVIKTILYLKNPIFTYRLLSVYKNTMHDEKKILILKCFINTGLSIFTEYFLSQFKKESKIVQYHILLYLVNAPNLSDEEIEGLYPLCSDLINNTNNIEEDIYLYNSLFLINQHNPIIKKKFKKLINHGRLAHSFLAYQYELERVSDFKVPVTKKIIEELEREDAEIQKLIRYDKDILRKLIEPIRKRLKEFEEHYNNRLQVFLKNLIWLNSHEIADVLTDSIEGTGKFNYKQMVLEFIIFFPLDEDRKNRIQDICFALLEDKKHIRIFDTLICMMILLFEHGGVKKIQEYFDSIDDEEHKSAVLSGIVSAIHNYGYGSMLSSFDLYHFNLIVGNTLNYLKSRKINNPRLISNVFKMIHYLNIGNYIDEMIELLDKYPFTYDAAKAFLSINTEKTFKAVHEELLRYQNDIISYAPMIRYIFDGINERNLKFYASLSRKMITTLLHHPLFTADIILYLHQYQIYDYTPSVIKFLKTENLQLRYNLLIYLGSIGAGDYLKDVFLLFKESDSFIKKIAAFILCESGETKYIRRVYKYYLINKKSVNEVKYIIKRLSNKLETIDANFRVLSSFNQLNILKKIDQAIKELSYKFFLYSGDLRSPPTPKSTGENQDSLDPAFIAIEPLLYAESQKAIHTAEGFYNFFQKEIIEHHNSTANYNFYSVIGEYNNFIYSLMYNLVTDKVSDLTGNDGYLRSLSNIFKNSYNYIEFFHREKKWTEMRFENDIIQNLIRLLLERKSNEIAGYLDNLNKIIQLLFMVLHNNPYYSISNPMRFPLDVFNRHNLVRLLYNFNNQIENLNEESTIEIMGRLKNIRSDAISVAKFYNEYQATITKSLPNKAF